MLNYKDTISSTTVFNLIESSTSLSIINPRKIQLDKNFFLNPEKRVSESILINLWKNLEENSNMTNYAALLGEYIPTTTRCLVTSLASQCGTLSEALESYTKYIDWINPSLKCTLSYDRNYTYIYFSLNKSKGYPNSAIIKSMSNVIHWARKSSNSNIELNTVTFDFIAPPFSDLLRQTFGKNIKFSKKFNMIKIESNALDKKLSNHNPNIKQLIEKSIIERKTDYIKDFEKKQVINKEFILKIIENLLSENKANIEYVCIKLSISRQTLYRRLKKENTHFKELINMVRKKRSKELLDLNNLTTTDISERLGYKEISSFYSAFKVWYGITVKEYKANLRSSY